MEENSTIRVLLLSGEFNSARMKLRDGFAQDGLEIVETVSPGEFYNRLADSDAEVLVVATDAIGSFSFGRFVEQIAEHGSHSPIVAIGAEGDDGGDAIQCLEEGAADYLPVSHVERLPLVIQRLRRESEKDRKLRGLQMEVQQAYTALLDNQKLMGIGRLAASIAHEINNPLESITNLLYLLRSDPSLSSVAENYVEMAEHEMSRVTQISKQTLNFYRETQAPVELRPAELLEEVLVLYARRIEEKRISVVRQFKSDVKLPVFPGEMRQVLSNLVTNAIEATPAGGKLILRVSRSKRWLDEGIEGVRIVVADNGCGIPVEVRQRLGQLFYTTKGQRGTGLGLWVTRAIVKRYGGEIQLFSSTQAHRHGTCFSIFLPTNMRPRAVALDGGPSGGAGSQPPSGRRLAGAIAIDSGNQFESDMIRARHHQSRRRRSATEGCAAS
jgi:two-component system NtrC family sensor kinase